MVKRRCARCGRKTHLEYAIDGRAYCSSCIFYANYRPCWKCQMYLPIAELQQYKGQWMCPYCLLDEREKDRKSEYKKEPLYTTRIKYSETCQRCGRETDLLYLYNGRILCSTCLEEEQKKWGTAGGGPAATPHRVTMGEEKGVLAQMFDALLIAIGLKRREKKKVKGAEIVAVKTKKKKKRKKRKPFKKKPMNEDIEEKAKGPFERYKKD